MTAWLHLVPALAVAAALAIVPGLPVAFALRLRGLSFAAASVAASFAAIALGSIAAPLIGLSWGVVPVLIVAVALTVVAFIVRLVSGRPAAHAPVVRAHRLAYLGAFLIAAALISYVVVTGVAKPENFSQSYDNVFHLNAVAWVLDTGNASPFAMTMSNPQVEQGFYPTLWHASVALVAQISGATIPAATNAFSIIVSAGVWPIAMLFFARPFFKASTPAILAAGILTAAFSAFPFHAFAWGILYPNLLSVALLPIALGFLHASLRHHALGDTGSIGAVWLAFVGAFGASILAHPNALLGLIVLSAPLIVSVAIENHRRFGKTSTFWVRLSAIVVAFAAMAVVWRLISTGDSTRDFGANPIAAALGALTNAPITDARAWFVTVFVVLGGVLIWRSRQNRWILFSYALVVMLYVIAASTVGPFRDFFTIGWYNDIHRLAFLMPIAAMPIASHAAAVALERVRPAGTEGPAIRSWLAPAIALMLLLTGTHGASMTAAKADMRAMFRQSDHDGPGLVSANEQRLMERLDETTPEDALIAANPWGGSGLAFALGGRHVLFPHLAGEWSPEAKELAGEWSSLPAGQACTLVNELGVTHMMESGERNYLDADDKYLGLHDLADSKLLEEIDREGDATLYAVTGC